MKIKNILIIIWSTWDANMAINYSKYIKWYNIFFLTSSKATFNKHKDTWINISFIDIFNYEENNSLEKKIKIFEDKYLLKNELTINQLKFSDRNFYNISFKEYKKRIIYLFEFIEKFLEKNDIDLSISQISSSAVVRIVSSIIRTNNKKHIYLNAYPLDKEKFIIADIDESWNSSIIDNNWNNIQNISNLEKNNIDEYINKFINKNKMYYKPKVWNIFSINNFKSLFKLIKEIELRWYSSIFNRIKIHINTYINAKKSLFLIKHKKLKNIKNKFIFFPIHISDDAQILVRNNYYYNQIELIKIISRYLPIWYYLAIKEHPANIWTFWYSNLKEIQKLHNVIIFSPYENSQEIIQKSEWLIVINWSAGLEALARQKKIILLWDTFYWKWKNIYKLHWYKDLLNWLKWMLNSKFNKNDFYKIFISILNWLFKWNPFNYYSEEQNYKKIWASIKKYIEN